MLHGEMQSAMAVRMLTSTVMFTVTRQRGPRSSRLFERRSPTHAVAWTFNGQLQLFAVVGVWSFEW
ncbi:hypothetical protein WI72_07690 [Burkholderia ubonensis]|nr:hypothetical protein WI72_07690 [Burkholderia ubonensis]KVD95559.1 hypothetical protein WI90_05165 [Burkholderia ubonensis]